MAKQERTITIVEAEIETALADVHAKQAIAQEALAKHESLVDELDVLRVASFDPELVALAESKGINPKNFATEAELRTATDRGLGDEA